MFVMKTRNGKASTMNSKINRIPSTEGKSTIFLFLLTIAENMLLAFPSEGLTKFSIYT